MKMEHSAETAIQSEMCEQNLAKNELSTKEDVEGVSTLTAAPTDMLQVAQNEFNRSRKIVIKNVENVTIEVCKMIFFAHHNHRWNNFNVQSCLPVFQMLHDKEVSSIVDTCQIKFILVKVYSKGLFLFCQ